MYNLRHVAIEEGHDKRSNVLTIDIGIGHDNHLVVTQLVEVGLLRVFTHAEANTKGLNDIVYLITLKGFVPHGFLYVQYLTTKGKNGLCCTAATLLGRTTC